MVVRVLVRIYYTILTVDTLKGWDIKDTDIKSAFLQERELERGVYIKPSLARNTLPGIVWKFKQSLHCILKDWARQLYFIVRKELVLIAFRVRS